MLRAQLIRKSELVSLTKKLISGSVSTLRNMASSTSEFKVTHDERNREFFIPLNEDRAVIQYEVIHGSNSQATVIDLQHTEVPESLRGKGIAKILAKEALDHFSHAKTPFKLTCWYLKKYYDENPNPEYKAFYVE